MDDELPVIIYIVLACSINNFFPNIYFVSDFIEFDPSIESEKKLITNIIVIIWKNKLK
jgi:hypothetical protein